MTATSLSHAPFVQGRVVDRIAALSAPGAFALAALSGALYAAAFPPLSWSIAAWVALVPLLVACAALSPLRAAMAGLCWTATMALGVAGFLPDMLSRYFGLAAVPSWLAAVVAAAFQGIYVSGYAAWVAWLVRRRAANPILLAGGWLVCEYARAHGMLGSPWALAAYSQLDWTKLIQIADLAGPYGIGVLIAAANAGAAALLAPVLRGCRPRRSAAMIAAALAGALVYGHWRLGQSFDDGGALRVAVVQGGATPPHTSQRTARLARYVALTKSGTTAPADLIVWPEYAVEAYLEEASPTRDAVLRLAQETQADVLLGGPHATPAASGTRYHNSVYLVRDGRLAGRYDKHRLVPFGEDDRLQWLFGRKRTSYTPGQGPYVLSASALRVGTFICVESMYPELVREVVRQDAELLVNLSNDAWFGDPAPARSQLAIATLRAVETRRYLVRAAATGFSAVIDAHGRTLAQSEFDTHEVLNATVRASRARTPYQRWGDVLALMVVAAVTGASLRPLLNNN
jgi:apolipoprotein N-acyltransferase